jgi:putative transposase
MHREIPKDAKFNNLVIKRTADMNYWAILNLTIDIKDEENQSVTECGIDLNIKNISVSDSSGASYQIKLPDFSKSKYLKTYKKQQELLSKRYKNKNFSKKTKKLQVKQNRVQQKIKNQKEDLFHKISKELTDNHNRITIENLQIKKMKESESTRLNRQISDVSWNSLITKIKYKADAKNVIVREINPAYSSQRCNQCGHISSNNRKTQSVFHCENCQTTENADLNASKNILYYDIWSLEQKAKWVAMPMKSSQVLIDSDVDLAR